jgi:hypothetical protein
MSKRIEGASMIYNLDKMNWFTETPSSADLIANSLCFSGGTRLSMRQFGEPCKPLANGFFSHLEVIGSLKVNPILRRLPKYLPEKQGHFSSNGTRSFYDMGYSHRGDSDSPGKLGLGNPQFVKNFFKKHPRMNRGKVVFGNHGLASLMVIDNFDIVSLSAFKSETYAPLIVDADAPLSGPVSGQRFQAVGRRHAKIVNHHSRVQLDQSFDRSLQNVRRKMLGFPRDKKPLGINVRESLNHGHTYKQNVYVCQPRKIIDTPVDLLEMTGGEGGFCGEYKSTYPIRDGGKNHRSRRNDGSQIAQQTSPCAVDKPTRSSWHTMSERNGQTS